jgi:hypothetical protein
VTVPITSDLAGYQAFWIEAFRTWKLIAGALIVALLVLGVELAILLVFLWKKL